MRSRILRHVNSFNSSIADPVSMFDTAAGWYDEPRIALADFLASDIFKFGNRSTRALPPSHTLGEASRRVYASMCEKFLRHLQDLQKTLLNADSSDIGLFFTGVLAESSHETRTRYVRLTERVFEHLKNRRLRENNPVSEWVQKGSMTKGNLRARRGPDAPTVSAADVNRLQDWLYTIGVNAIEIGDWREARDVTLASLSMGTGMRCAELIKLTRVQVKYWPGAGPEDKFEFDIPRWASVTTARQHRAMAERDCAALMQRWWETRWTGFGNSQHGADAPRTTPQGNRVFPSKLKGEELNTSTLYRNLFGVAARGIEIGILNESTRWVLERGAQGLRRAYVLSSLEMGVDPDLLTERLGHHHKRSVRRYMEPKSAAQRTFELDGPTTA